MFIQEIELLCKDISNAEKFYSEVLGLQIINKKAESISFKAGTSVLTFKQTRDQNPYYHFAFNIPNNQIKEAFQYFRKKVSVILYENSPIVDFRNWNAESLYFEDTNGNILECIARRDLTNESTKTFSGALLLSVSEIGLVVDDIQEACSIFKEKYQLLPYPKQPVLENFAALGDENGLLILSTPERHWFPTEKEVKKFPATVVFENKETTYNLVL